MVNISQRPAEATDRAVPGHWEGDLLIGKRNATAIGTLVGAHHRLRDAHPPADGYKPEHVAPALAEKIQTPPDALRRSLAWDQGIEMSNWKQVQIDTGLSIYFCDPHSPWQRGSNENTNGLLRQYFPKGFDFTDITEADLDAVADELNDRPRKRFAFATPNRATRRAHVALTARIRRLSTGQPGPGSVAPGRGPFLGLTCRFARFWLVARPGVSALLLLPPLAAPGGVVRPDARPVRERRCSDDDH